MEGDNFSEDMATLGAEAAWKSINQSGLNAIHQELARVLAHTLAGHVTEMGEDFHKLGIKNKERLPIIVAAANALVVAAQTMLSNLPGENNANRETLDTKPSCN